MDDQRCARSSSARISSWRYCANPAAISVRRRETGLAGAHYVVGGDVVVAGGLVVSTVVGGTVVVEATVVATVVGGVVLRGVVTAIVVEGTTTATVVDELVVVVPGVGDTLLFPVPTNATMMTSSRMNPPAHARAWTHGGVSRNRCQGFGGPRGGTVGGTPRMTCVGGSPAAGWATVGMALSGTALSGLSGRYHRPSDARRHPGPGPPV